MGREQDYVHIFLRHSRRSVNAGLPARAGALCRPAACVARPASVLFSWSSFLTLLGAWRSLFFAHFEVFRGRPFFLHFVGRLPLDQAIAPFYLGSSMPARPRNRSQLWSGPAPARIQTQNRRQRQSRCPLRGREKKSSTSSQPAVDAPIMAMPTTSSEKPRELLDHQANVGVLAAFAIAGTSWDPGLCRPCTALPGTLTELRGPQGFVPSLLLSGPGCILLQGPDLLFGQCLG